MYTQEHVAKFLRELKAPHVREEMSLPTLEYQVSYSDTVMVESDYEPRGAEFRVDGRDEDRNPPGPLSLATIGSNGRNPATGQMHFIGLDLDGSNHATGHDNLEPVIQRLRAIPWLQIHRSRSGNGFHLVAFPAHTLTAEDNSEAIALGRALAIRIAGEIDDEDFAGIVDCAGSIIFYYSPNPGQRGYQLIKPADELFPESLEPLYDPGDPDHDVDDVAELDDEHRRVVEWLKSNAKKDFTQAKPTIFHAHTTDIRGCHEALNLRGAFSTVASGKGDTKRNCWLRAIRGGGFIVGQWGSSLEDWKESRGGKYTLLNVAPKLVEFAESHGIVQDSRSKSYGFSREQAQELARLYGVELPESDSSFLSVSQEGGLLVFEQSVKPTDDLPPEWKRKSERKAYFSIVLPKGSNPNPDSRARVAFSPEGKNFQFFRRVHGDIWHQTTRDDAADRLLLMGLGKAAVNRHLTTDSPFKLVNEPFKGEFPSRYEWNIGAVQLTVQPAKEPGDYTHWQKVLNHCGEGLDEAVADEPWCQANGIRNGGDYLTLWAARLFRYPKARLPGIGMVSDQDNGKSTFAASLKRLMSRKGYCNSVSPLTTEFNKPLFGCVLWDLDDVDLSARHGELYRKLLQWMTSDILPVVAKGSDPVHVANSLHFVHTANDPACFAIQPGDTRWTLIEVPPLESQIPAETLTRALMREAPYFLKALFDLPMPQEPAGRMFLPVLDTRIKYRLMAERFQNTLSDDQIEWVRMLKELAKEDRLSELLTFDELKELMGSSAPASVRKFRSAWPKLAIALTNDGYDVKHRENNGGQYPAAWSVRRAA